MFNEFALDPSLVVYWCDKDGYVAFMKRFGIDARRIVSRFPKSWVREVERTFVQKYPSPSFNQTQRKIQMISLLTKSVVKRAATNYDGMVTWLENAESEQARRPFVGIVANDNPRSNPSVTVVRSADDILEQLDLLPSGSCVVNRAAEDMAAAVSPMLRCCNYAVFVDPHFDAKRRFIEPFRHFMEQLVSNRVASSTPITELHLAVDNQMNPAQEQREAAQRIAALQRQLPEVIPTGHKVKIVVWRERLRGQKLHNRYILTDIGSVSFGVGLDCNEESFHQSFSQSQTDDVSCLSETHHDSRWSEYVSAPAFDKVDEDTIIGTKIT